MDINQVTEIQILWKRETHETGHSFTVNTTFSIRKLSKDAKHSARWLCATIFVTSERRQYEDIFSYISNFFRVFVGFFFSQYLKEYERHECIEYHEIIEAKKTIFINCVFVHVSSIVKKSIQLCSQSNVNWN